MESTSKEKEKPYMVGVRDWATGRVREESESGWTAKDHKDHGLRAESGGPT